ncbi:MAG: acetate--CoA ligase [Candidatus Latescibacterota bacterium]|nr:MAG: acetate--CoA ligase [Candidatus Latescibacterota bacterium]
MPSNIGDPEARRRGFAWKDARRELGFPEGPCNIGWYCSDRISELGMGPKLALIWEAVDGTIRRFTYDDIRVYSNAYAKYLLGLGLAPGDRVAVFSERVPELYIGIIGGLKAGLVMQPLFSAFGEDALEKRIVNAETSAILTNRKLTFRVRKIRERCPSLRHIVINDPGDLEMQPGEVHFGIDNAEPVESFACFPATEETPSLLHYTSGTTGQPKGALHVHGSLPAQALTTKWVLDVRDDDIYWCTADPGWVTGVSYGVIGPWALGTTQYVLEAGFIIDRWYKAIQDQKITVWYSAPTAIRMLMKEGEEKVKQFDLSSLRHLCSVGEPLNPEAVVWSERVYGLPFLDTWWQTETGAIQVTNVPGMPVRPGSMGKPFPGVTATVLAHDFTEIREPNQQGLLALRPPWPSMFRTYWRNESAYQSKFKNGWYVTGDRARIDEDGYFWFMGRDDDVINTAGHLVGPFEIESALLEHEAVAESAAIGKPDPVNMEVVKAFVALKPGFEPNKKLEMSIMNFIRKKLSPLAMPQEIEFVEKLPKTRSGKIMRRVLRAQELGQDVGDLSTLDDN